MDCPAIDRLVEVSRSGEDLAVLAHTQVCEDCRATVRLLQALPGVFEPDIDLPEEWVQGVVARSPNATGGSAYRAAMVPAVVSGLLGSATVLAVLIQAAPAPQGSVTDLLFFSAVAGLAVVLFQLRTGRSELADGV